MRLKATISAAVLNSGIAARIASKGSSMLGSRLDDFRDVSDQMYTQELATKMYTEFPEPGRDEKKVAATQPRKMFKIEWLIAQKEKYPHVLIVGQTGSGKTLLAEYLIDKDKNTVSTFITPARDDNEFIDYSTVGTGFNYNAIEEYLSAVCSEMERRYETPLQDVIPEFGFRNVVIDEGTDIAKHSTTFSQSVLRLTGMARKRFIRVWLCTTAQNVKALNIEGEGESRQNFTYVRLGDEARRHLRQLIAAGRYTKEDEEWYIKQEDSYENGEYRMCIVDDSMCLLPDLSGYRKSKLERGATKPTEPTDNLLLQLPNGKENIDERYEQALMMFETGMNKTKIAEALNLKGDKRQSFWKGYEKWVAL